MLEARLPTAEEVDELIAFLPKLYAEGFQPVIQRRGGFKDDIFYDYPPDYAPEVKDFYHRVAGEAWFDEGYVPTQANQMLESEELVRTSSLAQVRAMLTFCMRGERFCNGHWSAMIECGHIRRLLERLVVLRSQMG